MSKLVSSQSPNPTLPEYYDKKGLLTFNLATATTPHGTNTRYYDFFAMPVIEW